MLRLVAGVLPGRLPQSTRPLARQIQYQSSRAGSQAERSRRRQHVKASPRFGSARKEEQRSKETTLILNQLQGEWGDDAGLRFKISGTKVHLLNQEKTVLDIGEESGALVLKGARLSCQQGSAASPVWQLPSGKEWRWARVAEAEDTAWTALFHQYKAERMKVRSQLYDAISRHDFSQMSILRAAWDGSFGFPLPAPSHLRERLAGGRSLVPGVCFKHRRTGCRGVILACEPRCTAPAMWKAQMGVASLAGGEAQPFYHCAWDKRDRPETRVGFVAEENIDACEGIFPVQAALVDNLLVPCEALGGYFVGRKLEVKLQQQCMNGVFLNIFR